MVTELAPEAVLTQDLDTLGDLLEAFDSVHSKIDGWCVRGKVCCFVSSSRPPAF